ncbi:sensor histidine kinase [Fibrella forsythiae]|uniref:histidine kinase n=1 Tax=Fibrella forsythiae TaxID=2817061 RepID=A0ABS3JS07_9BACT|nr:HAMP domain-containing sensor histidine kinase [Fibrella forsythiae]MBO0952763.1 HAMP domain-containing histidine kinase [Fibrella forsythiae]
MRLAVKLLLFFWLSTEFAFAQSFKFSDTYPVNNVDSLEKWIRDNPKPSVSRLKNLIHLERTYTWEYSGKIGTNLVEINRLTKKYNIPAARAVYYYLNGYQYHNKKRVYASIQYIKQALDLFQSANDISGLIHVYALLVQIQYDTFGDSIIKEDFFEKEYANELKKLLKISDNDHDYLQGKIAQSKSLTEQKYAKYMEQLMTEVLQKTKEKPSLRYAELRVRIDLSISLFLQGRIEESYLENRKIVASLHEGQFQELMVMYYNMSTDCKRLKRYTACVMYCNSGIAIIRRYEPKNYQYLREFYINLKVAATQQGNMADALAYSDSVFKYVNLAEEVENSQKMLEVESRFEFERKQIQIQKLQQQQHDADEQQRMMVLALAIVVIVALFFGVLVNQLREANRQLKALTQSRERFFSIIAHDLRRPMHTFHGMNKLVSYYLKTHRYEAIETLSQAIDEAGYKIQLLLDNLLRWALSQRDELPYHPETIALLPKLNEVIGLFESLSYKYPVTFSITCPDHFYIFADSNAIDLIFRNLIDNALKSMSQKGGSIRIEATQTDSQAITIYIKDTGNGMNLRQLVMIRHMLADHTNAQPGQTGVGLGLVLISQFTKRNRGRILVESSPAVGTTFTLTLPTTKTVAELTNPAYRRVPNTY